jgi:hypothetical protein
MTTLTHTPTEHDNSNYLIVGDDIDELIEYLVSRIRAQSKDYYAKNLREDLTKTRCSIVDRHAGQGTFYNVVLGPYVTLTVDAVQKVLNSSPNHIDGGNYFYDDPELSAIIQAATKEGYVIRISHTQAKWIDRGLNRLKQRARHFVPV